MVQNILFHQSSKRRHLDALSLLPLLISIVYGCKTVKRRFLDY